MKIMLCLLLYVCVIMMISMGSDAQHCVLGGKGNIMWGKISDTEGGFDGILRNDDLFGTSVSWISLSRLFWFEL